MNTSVICGYFLNSNPLSVFLFVLSFALIGHVCTKFSTRYRSIMRIAGFACNDSAITCPYGYNSTQAFHHTLCYAKINGQYTSGIPSSKESVTNRDTIEKGNEKINNNKLLWILLVVPILVSLVGVLFYCKRRNTVRRRKGISLSRYHQTSYPLSPEEQNTPINDPLLNNKGTADTTLSNKETQERVQSNEESPEQEQSNTNNVTFRNSAELKKKLDSFQPATSSQYPAYRNNKTRALSFGEILSKEMIENLATFGFFYEGVYFKTTCFHCGCKNSNWTEQDDILKTHLSLDESCAYVQYINSLLTTQ